MSSVVATAAQATTFTAASYPTSVSATGASFTVRAFGVVIVCLNASFQSDALSGPTEALEITQSHSDCLFGILPATLDFTSCAYALKPGAALGGGQVAIGATVKCATPGDAIDVTVFASHKAHEEHKPICHVFFPEQNLLKTSNLLATNEAGGVLKLEGKVEGIKATQIRTSGIACPPQEEDNVATYTISGGVDFSDPTGTAWDVG